MSSYSYEEECGHCGGVLCVFKDSSDMEGSGTMCLGCGRGLAMVESNMTLEELNEVRKESDMKPLDKLPYKAGAILDSLPQEVECPKCNQYIRFHCVDGTHHFE